MCEFVVWIKCGNGASEQFKRRNSLNAEASPEIGAASLRGCVRAPSLTVCILSSVICVSLRKSVS